MANKIKRKASIFMRVLVPLVVIVLLTVLLLVAALNIGGAFNQLQRNALDALDERTQNKSQTLQYEMVNRWSNLESTAEAMRSLIQRELLMAGATAEDMKSNASLNADILLDVAPTLVTRLRTGGTTGIFLILNGVGVAGQPDSWAGVYLRDTDPANNNTTNSDLLMLRGMPPVSRALGVSLDSYWQASFTFTEQEGDFFFKPLQAVQQGTSDDPVHYGYWCMPFRLDEENPTLALTYAMPILNKDGTVLGVLGVDLTASYITSLLNNGEFVRDEPGSYVLGLKQEDGTIRIACAAGTTYKQYFNQDDTVLTAAKSLGANDITLIGTRNGKEMIASVTPLTLYSPNTAFENDQWVLVGMQTADTLMAFSKHFRNVLAVAAFVALLLCVVIAVIASRQMTMPITRLVRQVQAAVPNQPLKLDETNTREIDALAEAITNLKDDADESAARLATILQMTGLRVGVFEIKKDSDVAYCSPGFIELLDCGEIPNENDHISRDAFRRVMRDRFTEAVDDDVWRFKVRSEELYLRYKQVDSDNRIVGTLMDVTEEMETRMHLERARDIDALTGILNRRAFARMTQELLGRRRDTMGIAALVMVDLDNLKFLNSTYGHDTGDNFIRAFAHALGAFEAEDHSIVARRSGDEFYMLLYGYDSREVLEEHIQNAWSQVSTQGLVLPDGSFYRFRASGGVAWYPDDAQTLSKLLHYADFAMYKVKQESKGNLESFNNDAYTEEAFLINAREALDRLIDNQLMHFAYQPIVSVKDGELWGYELLMRPDVPELKSPGAVLRLAKAQGKLHHIERLTWFCGLESVRLMIERGLMKKGMKLFINTIASQKMDLVERQHVIDCYSDLLPNVVLEVTESEDNNMDFTQRKMAFIRSNGGEVAIDDFGTGYNSELALVNIPCEYVKVDASFVRSVDRDTNKQALVKNLISYARARDIAVLAEGVETRDEMATLISFGVDYLQGFYLGMPREKPQQVLSTIRMEIRQLVWQNQNQTQ